MKTWRSARHPLANAAIQSNRLRSFLALDAERTGEQLLRDLRRPQG